MEQQSLKDIPQTPQEYRRQKGPIPPVAIFLVLGLLAVFLLFFGAPILDIFTGDNSRPN